MDDAVQKGRQAKGDMLPQSKLTRDDVINIRGRLKNGEAITEIASSYPHVSPKTVGSAGRRITWKHVQ